MLTLRPAGFADAEFLWTIANDPVVRWASHDRAPINWADHIAWLVATLEDDTVRIFVAEWSGVGIGTGRLDARGDGVWVSLSLLPHTRGNGYGSAMVRHLTALGGTHARVRDGNQPSHRAFQAAGYTGTQTEDGEWLYSR